MRRVEGEPALLRGGENNPSTWPHEWEVLLHDRMCFVVVQMLDQVRCEQ